MTSFVKKCGQEDNTKQILTRLGYNYVICQGKCLSIDIRKLSLSKKLT